MAACRGFFFLERQHLQGFGMHIIAMNMFDIAAKLVVIAFVCAFVCYWLLR